MKVTIEITSENTITTLDTGKEKYVQEWRLNGSGAETTDESVNWHDLSLTDELVEALEGLDGYEAMRALETEEAELPEEVVKTIEGVQLERGDVFFGIGVTVKGKHVPFRCKFPQDFDFVGDQENIFKEYSNARVHCEELDSANVNAQTQ